MVDMAASSNLEDNLDNPFGPWLYSVSTLHCMTVSLASGASGSALSGASRPPAECSTRRLRRGHGAPRARPGQQHHLRHPAAADR